MAQVRAIRQAGFTITGVVVDADYGSNAELRAGLERLGLPYGVALRGEPVCTVVGVPGPKSATAIAQSAPEERMGVRDLGDGHRRSVDRAVLCAARPADEWARRRVVAL